MQGGRKMDWEDAVKDWVTDRNFKLGVAHTLYKGSTRVCVHCGKGEYETRMNEAWEEPDECKEPQGNLTFFHTFW